MPYILFSWAAFKGDADFYKAGFSDYTSFNMAAFNSDAGFREALFRGNAHFREAAFSSDADFGEAAFSRGADFGEAAFSGHADFQDAAFSGYAQFEKVDFSEYADFSGSAFSKPAFFYGTSFNESLWLYSAKFGAECYFRELKLGEARFDACRFEKPAFFQIAAFKSGSFDGCFINHRLEFYQADLSRVSFLGAPLEDFRFIDCTWPMSRSRRVVYDARLVDGKGYYPLDNAAEPEEWDEFEKPPTPGTLADIFRRLKKIATAEQDHALASDWHFGEKDMVRRDHWLKLKTNRRPLKSFFQNLFSGFSLELYRASSGYGERPLRAVGLLLVFVAIPIIFTTDPGSYLPLIPASSTIKAGLWFSLAKGLWRLLITVQAGMFALAVRNRMRR